MRTHVKNSFRRDMNQFLREPGVTTQVYPKWSTKEERRSYIKNWSYPFGLRRFFRISALLLVNVSQGIQFPRPALSYAKTSSNAVEKYF
jgi:hypothetical protein